MEDQAWTPESFSCRGLDSFPDSIYSDGTNQETLLYSAGCLEVGIGEPFCDLWLGYDGKKVIRAFPPVHLASSIGKFDAHHVFDKINFPK